MTEGNKLFIVIFSTIFFCIGVFLMLRNSALYKDLITITSENDQDHYLYPQLSFEEGYQVSYAELVSTLCSKLEYNIEIDGVFIDRQQFSPEDISNYKIIDTIYKKNYVYNDNGCIEKIMYSGIKD